MCVFIIFWCTPRRRVVRTHACYSARANARAWLHDCAAGLQARVAFCMFLNANYVRVLIIGTFFRNKKKEIEHNFFFHGGNYAYIFG